MQKIIFDSSFLIAVVENPTAWHEDITEKVGRFEPVSLDCVLSELKSLSNERTTRARFASLAAELARDFKVVRCGQGGVDDELVSLAVSGDALVATVDRELIGRLRSLGKRGVTLRRGRVATF